MTDSKTFLATGGAGFIGSAVVREVIANTPHRVVNVDKLTYAGNLEIGLGQRQRTPPLHPGRYL